MSTDSTPRTTQDRYEMQRATLDRRPGCRQESKSGRSSSTSKRSYMTADSEPQPELLRRPRPRETTKRPAAAADDHGEKGLETAQSAAQLEPHFDRVEQHPDVFFDHTIDVRPAVTHEEIRPHIHTIYEQRRTRSIHYHEHRTLIQPIIDPNPTILPEQHWAQDHETGEIFKIPDELGRQLDEKYGRTDKASVTADDGDIIKAMKKLGLETNTPHAIQADPPNTESGDTNTGGNVVV